MPGPILKASKLVKHYGHIKAVDDVSFTVNKGDIYGFLGPNGSGKSTTIRMLLSLITPNSGSIELFGKPLTSNRSWVLSRIGALIERPDFYNYLSAYKNLSLLAQYSGIQLSEKEIMDKLQLVGLAERAHSKVRTFSQGMKQRLGLAQTLLHDPELIILDEPVNGLDPQGINDIRKLILSLNQEFGKTIIISSHILREMELIANRMVVINKGKVVVEGDVRSLISHGQQKLVISTTNNRKALAVLKKHFPSLEITENRIGELQTIAASSLVPEINKLLVNEQIDVKQLHLLNSLEDYFLHIT